MSRPAVSVIIPVFNAERFLERAVQSALHQPEVQEVVLVEDGSTDGSLALCESLLETDERLILLRHRDGRNRGPGCSRNCGIKGSRCDLIAFLDADDFYLPGRFADLHDWFETEEGDGLYFSVGNHFYDERGRDQHYQRCESIGSNPERTGLQVGCDPASLFRVLFKGRKGWLHLNALVVRRRLLERVGLFDESLRLGQDTDFILRCAYFGSLVSPQAEKVVAMRGVHQQNRILFTGLSVRKGFERARNRKWFHFALERGFDDELGRLAVRHYMDTLLSHRWFDCGPLRLGAASILFLALVLRYRVPLNWGLPERRASRSPFKIGVGSPHKVCQSNSRATKRQTSPEW